MKKIVPMDPNILCEKIKAQDNYGDLILPGQEDKRQSVRKVIYVSTQASNRGIAPGDIIVTRSPIYLELPIYLTEKDEMPFNSPDKLEIVDISQIIALYKEEKNETNTTD